MNTQRECDPDLWWGRRPVGIKILLGFVFTVAGIALIGLFGLVIMKLWNTLMPELFGLKTITYWQGWGLFLLSCIFFRRLGGGHGRAERRRKTELRRHIHTVMKRESTDREETSPES